MSEISLHTIVCKPRRERRGWQVRWTLPDERATAMSVGTRKIYFEPTITLGSVVSAVSMILAGLGVFFKLSGDVQVLSVQRQEEAKTLESIETLIAQRAPIRYDRPDAERDFEVRDRQIQEHEVRIHALEIDMAQTKSRRP